MKSQCFTSSSFGCQVHRVRVENTGRGPLTVRTNFDNKIDLLRVPVYSKKKKLHRQIPRNHVSPPETIHAHEGEAERNHQRLQALPCQYFRNKSINTVRTRLRKTSGNFQEQKAPPIDIIRLESTYREGFKRQWDWLKDRAFSPMRGATQHCDSQLLLRKNSFFLLNFIKKKQKAQENQPPSPHIAGIPNITSSIGLRQSLKKTTKFVPHRRTIVSQQKMASNSLNAPNNLLIDPW